MRAAIHQAHLDARSVARQGRREAARPRDGFAARKPEPDARASQAMVAANGAKTTDADLRLPGSTASTDAPPGTPSCMRASSASLTIGIWSASGCPTNTARTPCSL